MRPPYPRTRGIAPGPFLRKRRLLLPSYFRMLLGETEQGAPRPPVPPTAPGVSPLDPFCDAEVCFSRRLSACKFWGTEREPAGAMKTMKKGWQGKRAFPPAFFLFSPDAKHPDGGVPPPSPWVAVPRLSRINATFIYESMCACYAVSSGNCLCDKIRNIRKWVQG